MTLLKSQVYRDEKQTSSCQGLGTGAWKVEVGVRDCMKEFL